MALPNKINALVIGGGGREHAIVHALSKSNRIMNIHCIKGNAGITELATCESTPNTNRELVRYANDNKIHLVIVGPENYLANHIVKEFQCAGIAIIGPDMDGIQLESSKIFAKNFMKLHSIPTASSTVYEESQVESAINHVLKKMTPIVIKADGLCAGKGVVITSDINKAMLTVRHMLNGRLFGNAGRRIIIEDCLIGKELSFMAFTDGNTIVPMTSSRDHKPVFDGNLGQNTGGMGAYSPVPDITPEIKEKIMNTIMIPTLEGLKSLGIKYVGVLYAGIMLVNGEPYVLEYNCRFGDPEAQVILPRLKTDIVDICDAMLDGKLNEIDIYWKDKAAVGVVLSSIGYPENYTTGHKLNLSIPGNDVFVYHAGTKLTNEGLVTSGGRVICATALGDTITEAYKKVYEYVDLNNIGLHYRRDIAADAIESG